MTTDYRGIVTRRAAEIGTNEGKPGSTAACLQSVEELIWLAPFIDRLKPEVILEIGIYKGGWQWVMCPFYIEGAAIIGIDSMLRHKRDGGKGELLTQLECLDKCGFKTGMFFGRSDDEQIRNEVDKALLWFERLVDLLHIDGAHDYTSARADWDYYSKLVRPGGLVVLHDIATQTSQMNVKRVWEEIKAENPDKKTHEICLDAGIGVVVI